MRIRKSLILSLLLIIYIMKVEAQTVLPNNAYKTGEKLMFLMHYGWFDGGVAHLTLVEEEYEGKTVHHAVAIGETIGLANKIFNVHDIYESWFDIDNVTTYKQIRDVTEGRYKRRNVVTYNHADSSVVALLSGYHKVPEPIFDVVSAFYYVRRVVFDTLKVSQTVVLNTYFEDNVFVLKIRYRGIETITTKLGTFECMKFNPVVDPGRVFDSENDISIWITADSNHIPIRVELTLMIGSFQADLVGYSGLKNELVQKNKKQIK